MTAAGWYQDPEQPSQLRWWDGNQWTAHTQRSRVIMEPPPAPSRAAAVEVRPIVQPTTAGEYESEVARLRGEYEHWRKQVVEISELALLQEIGLYQYRHRLSNAAAYKDRLSQLQTRIKELVKSDGAVRRGTGWAINGSAAEGAKMVKDLSKLMLRAFNNEADDAVATMKPYALTAAINRLEKSRETISKLGASLKIEITDAYFALRVEELELTSDYLAKVAEEKERERAERERMRDEEQAQREIARERERLAKEKAHYEAALAAMRANGDLAAVAKTEAEIQKIDGAIEGVEKRAANTRAGYVYIISNIGSFGERMVKIGLTRRLDPMERVRELGDASVPFHFDKHAIVFSNDAVGLETELHHRFASRRVNAVNARREFFYATPSEVRHALGSLNANVLEWTEVPEAIEWRQSNAGRDISIAGATQEEV